MALWDVKIMNSHTFVPKFSSFSVPLRRFRSFQCFSNVLIHITGSENGYNGSNMLDTHEM